MLKCEICGFEDEKSILSHVRKAHEMTTKEYREKYNAPLRVSWMDAEAMGDFKKVGQANSALMKGKPGRATLEKGRWSRKHEGCIVCHETTFPHCCYGYCKLCWDKRAVREATAAKNSSLKEAGQEGINYVTCRICGLPFEMLSEEGHLKLHGVKEAEYKSMFPGTAMRSTRSRDRQSIGVSRGRVNLHKRRGYLNPPSMRDKKRLEMIDRHSRDDFCKVSLPERTLADWFRHHGYTVVVGSEPNLDPDVIHWQYPLFGKYCVDFACPRKEVVIEVLGDWWHGWDYVNGTKPYEQAHQKVKRNMHLDKIRFPDIEGRGWKLVKIWEHEMKDRSFVGKLLDMFPNKA